MFQRTEAQKSASRINGAKSHGPKTAETRQKSSFNSMKHGFTSKRVLLTGDNPDEFAAHRQIFLDRFQPAAASELLLVEDLVSADWRLRRILDAQTGLFEISVRRLDYPDDDPDYGTPLHHGDALADLARRIDHPLDVSNRYVNTLRARYDRRLRELQDLQAQRKALEACLEPSQTASPNEPENEDNYTADQQDTDDGTRESTPPRADPDLQ